MGMAGDPRFAMHAENKCPSSVFFSGVARTLRAFFRRSLISENQAAPLSAARLFSSVRGAQPRPGTGSSLPAARYTGPE
jgi:hypothetical protein